MPKQSDKVKAFLAEVVEVSRRHGLSLSHEDGHGSFEVEPLLQHNIQWLLDANDRAQPTE